MSEKVHSFIAKDEYYNIFSAEVKYDIVNVRLIIKDEFCLMAA